MSANPYAAMAARFRNELKHSCGALVGIVQGILADGELNDREIGFLSEWLAHQENIRLIFPGNIITEQVQQILSDGVIEPWEREHLLETLGQLVGGTLDQLASSQPVCELALDHIPELDIPERLFCFTGDFVFGPKSVCEQAVEVRGGVVQSNVTKRLHYLVVGGLGSPEWKHGSFGTKIERAIGYRASGTPIKIVHEDAWASSLCLFQPSPKADWPFPKDAG